MKPHRSALLLVCCALIPLLNFPRALFGDRSLFVRDINTVWSPQAESVVRQVAAGEAPYFDGRRGFGQPLFADPRAEVLYPPAWIHWVLPADRSYALFCAMHLIIGALGAARLARRLAPESGLEGSLIAAFAYGASGPLLSLVSHWHHLAAAAWMPWILAECAPGDARSPTRVGPLALLVALQCLAGSPDYLALTLLLCILRLATREDASLRGSLGAAGGLALGLMLSAVQLLPSLSFALDAARDRLPIGLALSPLHPALLIETVIPVRIAGWPLTREALDTLFRGMQVWMLSHYFGFTVWVFALVGVRQLGSQTRRFATGALVIGLLLACGVTASSAQEWIGRLPLVGGLRFPTKHLAGASLGLAMMAAGAARGRVGGESRRAFRIPLGLAIAAITAQTMLWFWGTAGAARPDGLSLRALGPIVLALAALLARRFGPLTCVLPLATAIDLLGAQASLNPTTPSGLFRDRPPLTAVIPAGSRLYVSDYSITPAGVSIRPPAGLPYSLARIPAGYSRAEGLTLAATWYLQPPIAGRFGYYGSFDLDILDFYRGPLKRAVQAFVTSRDAALVLDRLQRGSVDYVVTMDPPDLWRTLTPVAEESRFFADVVRVYQVPSPWPLARFETRAGDPDKAAGTPVIVERRDGRILVEAAPSNDTTLVVAIANDRGWRALVDGRPIGIEDNALAFIRVPLPAGRHGVELVYRPPLLNAGLTLSGLALLILGLAARRRPA